jgi:hypothetical protein
MDDRRERTSVLHELFRGEPAGPRASQQRPQCRKFKVSVQITSMTTLLRQGGRCVSADGPAQSATGRSTRPAMHLAAHLNYGARIASRYAFCPLINANEVFCT